MNDSEDDNHHIECHAAHKRHNAAVVQPRTFARTVSPPPARRPVNRPEDDQNLSTAAVEACHIVLDDPVTFFATRLQKAALSNRACHRQLSWDDWMNLYRRHQQSEGHHFVVHQHDHPVAGTHYDLRLQCNATSSISFAIMYGLPGDPNSRRLNRNATETRVHNLWNHLVETASHETGSMLIWDTGKYEVLPYDDDTTQESTDEDADQTRNPWLSLPEAAKLHQSFQQRKIRLRLTGSRLPLDYTITLRCSSQHGRQEQPRRPTRHQKRSELTSQRPRKRPGREASKQMTSDSDSDSDSHSVTDTRAVEMKPLVTLAIDAGSYESQKSVPRPSGRAYCREDEQETIRRSNAYTGATNSINSIHQRRWYLSLDRIRSGFVKRFVESRSALDTPRYQWVPQHLTGPASADDAVRPAGFPAFHVLGRDHERSIVTGRLAKDILGDEGVIDYVPRNGWSAITE